MSTGERKVEKIALRIALAFNLVYLIGLFSFARGTWAAHAWTDLFWLASGVAATAACARTWKRSAESEARSGWLWLGLGTGLWTVGISIWSWQELINGRFSPSPGATDIGPLGLGICSLIAVLKCIKPSERSKVTFDKILELVLSIASIGLINGLSFWLPLSELHIEFRLLIVPAINSLAYSTGLVLGVFYFAQGRPRTSMVAALLILVGLATNLGAHTAYVYAHLLNRYEAGLLIDALWMLTFTFISLAAVFEPRAQSEGPSEFWSGFSPKFVSGFCWLFFLGGLSLGLFSYREFLPAGVFRSLLLGVIFVVFVVIFLQFNWMKEMRLRHAVERALSARDEFLSVASHELNTPITSLAGNLTLLETWQASGELKASDPATLTDAIFRSRRQIDYLTRLVDGLLNTRRLSEGKIQIHPAPFDLSALVEKVVARMSNEIGRSGSTVEKVLPKSTSVKWDELRMEQVLTNLLSNALKFGNGKPVQIQIVEDRDHVDLVVIDGGIGVDPKDQKRIFDPFERAVSFKNYAGFGLGLYVTRQIAEAHGGTVRVESRLGQGARFIFSAPRQV